MDIRIEMNIMDMMKLIKAEIWWDCLSNEEKLHIYDSAIQMRENDDEKTL